PPAPAVEVTEHRIYKGWCEPCQKWHEAPVDFREQVLGQGRIGVRLASLIAYLRTVMACRCANSRMCCGPCMALRLAWENSWNSCIGSGSMRNQCLRV